MRRRSGDKLWREFLHDIVAPPDRLEPGGLDRFSREREIKEYNETVAEIENSGARNYGKLK